MTHFGVFAFAFVVTVSKVNAETSYSTGATGYGCPTLFNFYGDVYDCTKFYRCFWGEAYSFKCPSSTRWSQSLLTCDHEYNVPCETNSKEGYITAPEPQSSEEEHHNEPESESYHGDNESNHGDSASYHGNSASHHGDSASHHGDSASHHGDSASHHGDSKSYHGDSKSHHGDSASYNGDSSEGRYVDYSQDGWGASNSYYNYNNYNDGYKKKQNHGTKNYASPYTGNYHQSGVNNPYRVNPPFYVNRPYGYTQPGFLGYGYNYGYNYPGYNGYSGYGVNNNNNNNNNNNADYIARGQGLTRFLANFQKK
ncbi:uncharacterized protein [Littorina saxatilis]|uniref:uncharacterized protein n=1 Tax=Littorina saxatilis TaxID=31220 RepID=UPI0038B5764A